MINDNLEDCDENILNIMTSKKISELPQKNSDEIAEKVKELTK